jgi:hypothetical protein
VLVRLGDPRVFFPGFRCHSFLACRPLRPRGDQNRFVPVLRFRRRPSPNFNWLGSPAYPAIRFPQGMNYRASWFAFATACQVARPLCGSDRITSGHRDFYFQASSESVTLLAAGYNYGSHWIVLPMGLSPIGLTARPCCTEVFCSAHPERGRYRPIPLSPNSSPERETRLRSRSEGSRK